MTNKITREELQSFKDIIKMEKLMLEKIMKSNPDIMNVYWNDNMIVIQFQSGKPLSSDYLDNLHDLIDYKKYTVETVTVEEEFFKMKYKEEILQLNIQL